MSKHNSRKLIVSSLNLFVMASVALLVTAVNALGQTVTTTTSVTDGRTPSGLQAGSPAGSYPLSGFDNVNLYNGNLNFHLPLLQVGGRGSAQMSITLALNLKSWHIRHIHKVMPDGSELDSYVPTQTGWLPYSGYGPGRLDGRNYGLQTSSNLGCRWYSKTLSRLTFSASDGTEYELRDQLTSGQPLDSTCTQGVNRGTVFITADGTAATFVSDSAISDDPTVNAFGPHVFSVSGYLMLRDGTRYRIDNGNVSWIRDRNGNKISFGYTSNSMTITDQLNRTVTVNYDVSDVAPYGLCDQVIYKGFGGTQRILRVSKTNLGNALRANSGYTIRTLGGPTGLFPETDGSGSTNHDPTITSAVWLPDGRSYRFYYNSFGELARVELPTGGAYEYDMTSGSGVICPNFCAPDDDREIYRRVVERRVYPNGGSGNSFEHREVYTTSETFGSTTATVTVEQLGPAGSVVSRSRHLFASSALDSLFVGDVAQPYGAWYEGNETQTEALATTGDISTATVLQRTTTTRVQRGPVPWWASYTSIHPSLINKEPPNDPRITETVTTIEPATTNLVTKQTFGYDDTVPFNNQNNVKEYDFGTGVVGSLIRETRTTFVTNSTYTGTSVHLRSLPLQISIHDAAGIERSRATFEYDNYSQEGGDCEHSFHCLKTRTNVSGFCSVVTTPTSCDNSNPAGVVQRGNRSASTSYFLSNGSVTGSITAYTQYDVVGNVIRVIDPRSTLANIIASAVEYDDRFGSPNGEARTNTVPLELGTLTTYAFPTKTINALGHTAFSQFDYYLGQAVDAEDINGIVSSAYFEDLLERPSKLIRAVNQAASVKAETRFDYDDVNRSITTKTDLNSFEDPNPIKNQVLYDGLGRTTEKRQYENSTAYITVKIEYDAAGRAFKMSNPFRSGEPVLWTTSLFDPRGRVLSVTSPDNAVVSTAYSGNRVLVTDQTSKQRLSLTDALGRLKDVWEVTSPDSATEAVTFPGHAEVTAGYRTSYLYDWSDNLVKTTQGSQNRYFMYDSLNRLIRARNPEQSTYGPISDITDPITLNNAWSLKYEYDVAGNLFRKTDPRGISATYQYDSLNRNTSVDYSDATPDVFRQYDLAINGKGLLNQVWQAGSTISATYIDSYDALGRPLIQRQRYQTNSVWSASYQVQRAYNLAGLVTLQTYPSTRTVSYSYDSAGRPSSFSGMLGDGTNRTYSTEILYSPFGGIAKEKFGTTAPIYNKLFYNNRGQLSEIRAGTTYNGPADTGWERGAIINHYSAQCWGVCQPTSSMTDNNGNLKQQDHWIPDANGGVQAVYTQNYDYDSLNRVKRVREGSSQQEYVYDRWGNRTIHQTNTFGTGIPKPNFGVDTSTNRLTAPAGFSMNYDPAGNLTADTYTGAGNRTYDGENRMVQAWGGNNQWQYYTYSADGQRTRRKIDGVETWQIYGFAGELVAEYPGNAAVSSPTKEYGYRNGQLLVTAEAATAPPTNVALASNGATVTASSTVTGFAASGAINGDRRGLFVGQNGYWAASATGAAWLEVQFNGSKTISEIDVVAVQDNYNAPIEPTDSMTFSNYGITAYDVQYWNGSSWTTISGGSVTGNNKVWRKFTFASISTTKIRVSCNAAVDGYARLVEVEAWTGPSPAPRFDLALGATATASSSAGSGWGPSGVINGDRKSLNWGNGGGWADAAPVNSFPDWLQVDFGTSRTIAEIDVFTLQDNYAGSSEPTETMTFTQWGVTGYDVQYWDGSNWITVPGGSVTGNNKVWRKFTFSPITTSKIRVLTNAAADGYSRLTEIEAYAPAESSGSGGIHWLVSDQLGTPRMVFDQSGSLANVKRHDYLPFGEQLFAGTDGRTAAQGYSGDNVRQQFTQKERDSETGLDYLLARYYSSSQGRFTSIDPENYQASLDPTEPQSWNAYSYVNNNPLARVDPDGRGFFSKLKNWLLWDIWGEEDDVKKEEQKRRDMMLRMQREAPNGELIVQSPVSGEWMLLHPETMDRWSVFLWSDAISSSNGSRDLTPQEAASVIDSNVGAMRRLEYEASPKHGTQTRGNVSAAPGNGQDALDNSIQVKDTSPRRVGVDYQTREFVVFDQTSPGKFHGHVRTWEQLTQEMKNALIKSGLASSSGKIN